MGGPPFSLLLAVGQSSIMWPFGGDNQFLGHGGRERGGGLGSYKSTRVAFYTFLPLSFEPGFFSASLSLLSAATARISSRLDPNRTKLGSRFSGPGPLVYEVVGAVMREQLALQIGWARSWTATPVGRITARSGPPPRPGTRLAVLGKWVANGDVGQRRGYGLLGAGDRSWQAVEEVDTSIGYLLLFLSRGEGGLRREPVSSYRGSEVLPVCGCFFCPRMRLSIAYATLLLTW
ncbi:hypothetical protein LX32DRAFT_334967 [Colletotrichum zoysiae]|uniref:Uncharacterized protein n=1 Tax=Colletotrichum zoysiae TaxID=1216348 RepID=A0AAD9HJX5_9PEZI|nr:hypothetical protein LX32DRAFT_334967 [Colletotrichum zoysiae]